MMYLGDFKSGQNIKFGFTLSVADVVTALGGAPAVKVWRDNSATEFNTGVTLTANFDSASYNLIEIDTSDLTKYPPGNDYRVVATAGTLGLGSFIGRVLAHFSIENRNNSVSRGIV